MYAYSMTEPSASFEQMRFALASWLELSDLQWRTFAGIFNEKRVAHTEHLLHPGDQDYELVFVCEGLLRFYYPAADGSETNKAFVTNGFAGPLAASGLGLPILYGVEALEDTLLLTADMGAFRALFDEHPVFDRFGRLLAEAMLRRKELRARSLLQQSATERYLAFKEQHPELLRRLPQYHIASYLGITEVSLSRLKRELRPHYA